MIKTLIALLLLTSFAITTTGCAEDEAAEEGTFTLTGSGS